MSLRITITGPESTGKTTLCAVLAQQFGGIVIKEYARVHLQGEHGYTWDDLVTIAIKQDKAIQQASASSLLHIVDTDGLTTYLWALDKYDRDDPILFQLWQSHLPDLYLLCFPDLPWEEDPLREDPHRLPELFNLYHKHIMTSGVPYLIVKGKGDKRSQKAIRLITNLTK